MAAKSAALASVTAVSSVAFILLVNPPNRGVVRDVRQRYRQRQYGRGMSQHLEVTLASLNSHGGRGADGVLFDLAAACRQAMRGRTFPAGRPQEGRGCPA